MTTNFSATSPLSRLSIIIRRMNNNNDFLYTALMNTVEQIDIKNCIRSSRFMSSPIFLFLFLFFHLSSIVTTSSSSSSSVHDGAKGGGRLRKRDVSCTFIPTGNMNLFSKHTIDTKVISNNGPTTDYEYLLSTRYSQAYSFQDGTIDVTREYNTTLKYNDSSTPPSSTIQTISSSHSLHYRIHNRMNLSSQKAAPILVIHGGPGVPSDYLYPLTKVIPYRSLIFYDQLGCGRSSGPDDINAYSIEQSIDDLELLIKKLSLKRFHLYGQSFGGILAFEYMKRVAERSSIYNFEDPECLSVVLSSSPTDVAQVEATANGIIEKFLNEDDDMSSIAERFRLQSQCRIVDKPQPLIDAYDHAGTIWRGTDVIKEWKAEKPVDGSRRMPSALVMRGEYDFVSHECVKKWKDVFNHQFVRMKVLDGCSHHGLLELPVIYGEVVDSFFCEYD